MPKYHAFISYSQASSRSLATAVERNLKRFAKPWYRVRSLSIFRDETDLSATPRLWSVIKQALDQSAFFILIADPISAKSPWVDRELQYWLETKSPETIIVIVADGLLIWDASSGCFDPLKSDALPPRLMKAFAEEPLFVDMRWARNSTTLSLHDPQFFNQIAELAAPLYGKSKAELASTEVFEHRRTVRTAWSAAIVLFVLLVAAGILAVVADIERRVANDHKREAEKTLARSDFIRGIGQVDNDRTGIAIPHLGRSLLLEPSRVATAARLASLLVQRWHPHLAETGPTLPDQIKFLSYSPSGHFLAAASYNTLQVWDVLSRKAVTAPFDHKLPITHIEFSRDERWLISSSTSNGDDEPAHGEVHLWDMRAPETPVQEIPVDGMLWSAKFAPNSTTYATASAFAIEFRNVSGPGSVIDTIKFADLKQSIPNLDASVDNAFADFAFVSDGDLVFVFGASAPGLVARWGTGGGIRRLQELPLVPGPLLISIRSSSALLTFPNNVMDVFRFGNQARHSTSLILDINTLEPKGDPMAHGELVTDIGFAPHGRTVLSATRNGRLKLWEAPSGSPLGYDGQHQDSILSIDIASHGLAFASGSADGTARIWNSFTTRLSSEPIVHSSPVSIVKFDAQATHLATGSSDGKVLIWDALPQRAFPVRLPGTDKVQLAELTPDGRRLVAYNNSGIVTVWDTLTLKKLNQLNAPDSVNIHISKDFLIIENQ